MPSWAGSGPPEQSSRAAGGAQPGWPEMGCSPPEGTGALGDGSPVCVCGSVASWEFKGKARTASRAFQSKFLLAENGVFLVSTASRNQGVDPCSPAPAAFGNVSAVTAFVYYRNSFVVLLYPRIGSVLSREQSQNPCPGAWQMGARG